MTVDNKLPSPETELAARIVRLKKEKGAVILAHYYTLPEVQQQNTHHDPGAYGTGRFSAVLPQMQVYLRDPLQRRKNGRSCAGKGLRI